MSEWETKKLGEIFNKEQRKKLKKFMKEHKGEDPFELTTELRQLFSLWREDLKRKGILSDYLAYAFAYQWKKFGTDRVIQELRKVI